MESTYIKHIQNGIRFINNDTKSPQEAKIGESLNKLKELNLGMYEELMESYKGAVSKYKIRNNK